MLPERHTRRLDRRQFLAAGGAIVGGFCNAGGEAPLAADFKIGLYLDVPEVWHDPYRFFRW